MKPIYISGPITGIKQFKDHFLDCELYLIKEGVYNPVNPAKQVPILLEEYKIKYPEYNNYMKCALILMMQNNCKDIILLPSWQYSKCACIELLYAKFFNYKIHMYYKNIKNGNKRVELKNNYRNKY